MQVEVYYLAEVLWLCMFTHETWGLTCPAKQFWTQCLRFLLLWYQSYMTGLFANDVSVTQGTMKDWPQKKLAPYLVCCLALMLLPFWIPLCHEGYLYFYFPEPLLTKCWNSALGNYRLGSLCGSNLSRCNTFLKFDIHDGPWKFHRRFGHRAPRSGTLSGPPSQRYDLEGGCPWRLFMVALPAGL